MIKPSSVIRLWLLVSIGTMIFHEGFSQNPPFRVPLQLSDTTGAGDTTLRIRNLNPYFTLHVDSTLSYQMEINKDPSRYFFFMKNAPVGLKIRENGLLTFKA